MKRSPELQPLSRDHHQALFAALRLRRADADSAEAAAEVFLDFWREHGRRHFQLEEEVLLPAFVLGGGDPTDALVARVLVDHIEIRARARRLKEESRLPALHDLGERLAAHVRLEEDQLFPLIERTLSHDALAALGAELDRAEHSG